MLTDVKTRCVDHLKAAGLSVTGDDVRLWLYTHDQNNQASHIQPRSALVKDGFLKPGEAPDDETEMNSGIEFPG